MKTFLYKVMVFGFLATIVVYLLARFFAGGATDPYYRRYTSAAQSSLIIGTSRAAQALQPAVLNAVLAESTFELPLYNFAFTLVHSPYGPGYLRSIKKKLKSTVHNGLFILSVEPWALTRQQSNAKDDPHLFREAHRHPGQMFTVSSAPNLEYLLRYLQTDWFTLVERRFRSMPAFVHDDGWLEVNIAMHNTGISEKAEISEREETNMQFYRNYMHKVVLSPTRLTYLSHTIAWLQQHGHVYLVRLPVFCPLFDLERQFMPNFDRLMDDMAQAFKVPYFNYAKACDTFETIDGVHVQKSYGKTLSALVGLDIVDAMTREPSTPH